MPLLTNTNQEWHLSCDVTAARRFAVDDPRLHARPTRAPCSSRESTTASRRFTSRSEMAGSTFTSHSTSATPSSDDCNDEWPYISIKHSYYPLVVFDVVSFQPWSMKMLMLLPRPVCCRCRSVMIAAARLLATSIVDVDVALRWFSLYLAVAQRTGGLLLYYGEINSRFGSQKCIIPFLSEVSGVLSISPPSVLRATAGY